MDYGFRLPSAVDNRPLKFAEFERMLKQGHLCRRRRAPMSWSMRGGIEQIIRPTGLMDPLIDVRSAKGGGQSAGGGPGGSGEGQSRSRDDL